MTLIEAFDLAVELAITAPSKEKAKQATELAEGFAMLLTDEEVQSVKEKYEQC